MPKPVPDEPDGRSTTDRPSSDYLTNELGALASVIGLQTDVKGKPDSEAEQPESTPDRRSLRRTISPSGWPERLGRASRPASRLLVALSLLLVIHAAISLPGESVPGLAPALAATATLESLQRSLATPLGTRGGAISPQDVGPSSLEAQGQISTTVARLESDLRTLKKEVAAMESAEKGPSAYLIEMMLAVAGLLVAHALTALQGRRKIRHLEVRLKTAEFKAGL